MPQDNRIPQLAFEGPSPTQNFLSSFRQARADRQSEEERRRVAQRQAKADADQEQMRMIEMVGAAAVGATTPEAWAATGQRLEQMGVKGASAVPFEQRGSIIAMSKQAQELLGSQRAQLNADRQFGLQRDQFTENRRNNMAMEGIARERSAGGGARGFKPMDGKRQTNENNWLGEIQIAGNLANDVAGFSSQIDSGELNPSLLANAYNDAKSWAGVVDDNDPAAINYNRYRAFLEKMRNESLLLAKGVQTEGDAKRAWDALFRGMNSTAVVKAQLAEIQRINERAVRQKAALVRNQRKGFFGPTYEEPDWQDIGVDPSLFEAPRTAPTSFTRGGAGVFTDTQAGQSSAPAADGWSVKRVR